MVWVWVGLWSNCRVGSGLECLQVCVSVFVGKLVVGWCVLQVPLFWNW